MAFQLDQVVPWGRSYSEYCSMFNLTKTDRQKSILGIADGPASFNARFSQQCSGSIISVDPIYQFSRQEIQQRIDEIFDTIVIQIEKNAIHFNLDKFGSVQALAESRKQTMNDFLQDFETGLSEGRYLNAALPDLPFEDHNFDLALCSHFLFLYSIQLDFDFHLKALIELSRVAQEVRIYPLLDLSHQPSKHLPPIQSCLKEHGLNAEMIKVDYEFQIGANRMLVIKNN